jgi:short chain dehydrogenase
MTWILFAVLPLASLCTGFAPTYLQGKQSILLAGFDEYTDSASLSRREAIQNAGLVFSAALLPAIPKSPAIAGEPKTIVLTGANSGIGFEAVKTLASQGHTIVMPCRTLAKSLDAIQRVGPTAGTLVAAECDLTSLRSIQSFAKELPSLLASTNSKHISVLGLNAGISRNINAVDVARTLDGFELTVGTNHFGHFALNKLLLPMVDKKEGKIVVTASGVHDPEAPGKAYSYDCLG